ncbi:hypothetical protein [Empedobacter falsenii]|uniref:hypothetical protein n=1 Tax=Empedobacter falsenii TaxID=343874 RepID=UPI001C8EE631|nr:hypothetical protein [Empedobacter falsenii]MBY0066772.1 hypothetical protein [Empedobacter falsenii]
MHKNILSTITYVIKTRFCTSSKEFQTTQFNSDNGLKNRLDAFNFLENYIEIISNEGLLQIESNFIQPKAIDRINTEINFPNENNYKRLKLVNQEAIFITPNETIFPYGISLSFVLNEDFDSLKKDNEYEIYSLKNYEQINYSEQLNSLINEYKLLKNLGFEKQIDAIKLNKNLFSNFAIKDDYFKIFDTPFLWNNLTRQFFINNISNNEFILDCLYDHLFHYQDFDYVQFLEKNCPKEIEKNIYAMLHGQGGLLFVGYHPENLTESIMSDVELINYYNLLDANFSQDEYLYKNINLQIFSFNDFPVLAITVFPLNEESKKNHAYNPDKIFVLKNNRFIKMKDS